MGGGGGEASVSGMPDSGVSGGVDVPVSASDWAVRGSGVPASDSAAARAQTHVLLLVGTRIRLVFAPPSVVNEIHSWPPEPVPVMSMFVTALLSA